MMTKNCLKVELRGEVSGCIGDYLDIAPEKFIEAKFRRIFTWNVQRTPRAWSSSIRCLLKKIGLNFANLAIGIDQIVPGWCEGYIAEEDILWMTHGNGGPKSEELKALEAIRGCSCDIRCWKSSLRELVAVERSPLKAKIACSAWLRPLSGDAEVLAKWNIIKLTKAGWDAIQNILWEKGDGFGVSSKKFGSGHHILEFNFFWRFGNSRMLAKNDETLQ